MLNLNLPLLSERLRLQQLNKQIELYFCLDIDSTVNLIYQSGKKKQNKILSSITVTKLLYQEPKNDEKKIQYEI